MKKLGIILALAAIASAAIAGGPSPERGKELFTSTTLGTTGKSCASCHPDGKELAEAATYDAAQLAKIVNQCITKALKGNALASASHDMKSFIMYIKTFAVPEKR
jgi:cytochrome c